MKKILLVLLFGMLLGSCVKEPVIEKHELTFMSADFIEKTIYMKDNTLNKCVSISYSQQLFGCPLIDLLECFGRPTFVFYYSDGLYYSLNK